MKLDGNVSIIGTFMDREQFHCPLLEEVTTILLIIFALRTSDSHKSC
jgi:hypothetical protein